MYGLDADLLFLGLATHEAYFTNIKESVFETVNGFQVMSLWGLRQYVERDLRPIALPFHWNFERAIGDFILLCFTAGNNFLLVLPGISISAGVISAIAIEY
jgi:5'-3' exonuclease